MPAIAMATASRRVALAACALAALTFGIAQAQTTQPATAPTGATSPAAPRLTIGEIHDRMEAAGFREIRKVEFEAGRYEVKARNAKGERVKLDVDATTGAVERERKHD